MPRWAALAAALLAVAVIAGVLGAGALLRHGRSVPAVPSASPAASPSPAVSPSPAASPTARTAPASLPGGFIELDAVDGSTVFVLLCTHPNNGQCQYWVAVTTDGGATWSEPVKVGAQVTTGESGHHIHFVDANDGFVYGNQEAYVTHDGARTWHDTGLTFLAVQAVVGRTPWAWVVTYPCAKGTTPSCPFRAYLTSDGGKTWARQIDLGSLSPRLAVPFGEGGLAVSGLGGGDLFIIPPGAGEGHYVTGACPGDTSTVYMATPDGTEIWEMCSAAFPDNTPTALFVSEDGGATWLKRGLPSGLGPQADLVSTAPGSALLVSTSTPVESTSDAGKSWRPVSRETGFDWIELTSATDAWAGKPDGSVWLSADGGKTWTELVAAPATGSG